MTSFVTNGPEIMVLIFAVGVGAAIGAGRAGLTGLAVGAIAGPIVLVLVVLGLFGAAWLVTRVRARFAPREGEGGEDEM